MCGGSTLQHLSEDEIVYAVKTRSGSEDEVIIFVV
jgi:hypothetical protein